jgi:hypothetical protein
MAGIGLFVVLLRPAAGSRTGPRLATPPAGRPVRLPCRRRSARRTCAGCRPGRPVIAAADTDATTAIRLPPNIPSCREAVARLGLPRAFGWSVGAELIGSWHYRWVKDAGVEDRGRHAGAGAKQERVMSPWLRELR